MRKISFPIWHFATGKDTAWMRSKKRLWICGKLTTGLPSLGNTIRVWDSRKPWEIDKIEEINIGWNTITPFHHLTNAGQHISKNCWWNAGYGMEHFEPCHPHSCVHGPFCNSQAEDMERTDTCFSMNSEGNFLHWLHRNQGIDWFNHHQIPIVHYLWCIQKQAWKLFKSSVYHSNILIWWNDKHLTIYHSFIICKIVNYIW